MVKLFLFIIGRIRFEARLFPVFFFFLSFITLFSLCNDASNKRYEARIKSKRDDVKVIFKILRVRRVI